MAAATGRVARQRVLAAVVIGSGIAAQRLSPGQTGLELLENAAATAAGLFAIISMFGPVSGGHFNPVVSFADAAFGGLRWRDAAAYLPAQVAGCTGGAVLANLMFARAAVSVSAQDRSSAAHFLSEIVATLGLVLVIFALARSGRSRAVPAAVGAYIGAGVLLHVLDQLRQPGHHRGPDVLGHLRRDRPGVRAGLRRRPRSSAAAWPSWSSGSSIRPPPRPRPPRSSSPRKGGPDACPGCCLSASTTRAGPRWPPPCSTTKPEGASR